MNLRLIETMSTAAAVAILASVSAPVAAQDASDYRAVVDVVNDIDHAVDDKDWDRAGGHFVETITADLPGSEATSMPSGDLVGGWRSSLHDGKESFHLRGGHVVRFDGPDAAEVESNAYAWNRVDGIAGDDLYEVWGRYVHGLERTDAGWRVTSFAYEPFLERGNMDVVSHRPDG